MGIPFSTSAIFTVNSPFLFTNSFVPSNGSTIHKYVKDFLSSNELCIPSSLKMGIPDAFNSFSITSLERWSAMVNGD